MRFHPVRPRLRIRLQLRQHFQGLRLQLLIWFLVLALLPAAALSYLATTLTRQAVYQQTEAALVVQARELGGRLAQFINERISDIQNLATLETLQRADVTIDVKAKAVRSALTNGIVAAYLLDPAGNVIVSEGTVAAGNMASTSWFQTAMSGQDAFSDLEVSPNLGQPTIVLASPVWSVDGMIQGVLAAELSQAELQKLIDEVQAGYEQQNLRGHAFLVSSGGLHLTSFDSYQVLQPNALGLDAACKRSSAGQDGTLTVQLGHAPWLTAYAPVKGFGAYTGNHWTLFVSRPESELSAQAAQLQLYVFVALGVLLVVSILLALLVSGRIATPLRRLAAVVQEVANGNLDVAVAERKGHDELASLTGAVRQMLDSLRGVVQQMIHSSQQVASMSEQLASGSHQAAAATQQIAQTVSQVAAGAQEQTRVVATSSQNVQELIERIAQLAKGATTQSSAVARASGNVADMDQALAKTSAALEDASTLSEQNAQTASAGADAVSQMVSSMDRIQKSTQEVADRVQELEGHSQAIGEILEVIQSIAEQTNLLALNAAIEAARVGEQGKGFAVVAEEIRRLAERSSHETQQIGHIVSDVRDGIKRAVEAIKSGSAEVENGHRTVRQTGEALQLIRSGAQQTGERIAQVVQLSKHLEEASSRVRQATEEIQQISTDNAQAATEMAARTQEVRTSMESLAAVSEENAASSEEVSASTEQMNASIQEVTASAEQLAKLGQELSAAVHQFKLSSASER